MPQNKPTNESKPARASIRLEKHQREHRAYCFVESFPVRGGVFGTLAIWAKIRTVLPGPRFGPLSQMKALKCT